MSQEEAGRQLGGGMNEKMLDSWNPLLARLSAEVTVARRNVHLIAATSAKKVIPRYLNISLVT